MPKLAGWDPGAFIFSRASILPRAAAALQRLVHPPFSLPCFGTCLLGLGLGLLGEGLLLLGVPLGLGNLFLSGLGLLLGGGLRLGQPPFSLRCCGTCLPGLGLGLLGEGLLLLGVPLGLGNLFLSGLGLLLGGGLRLGQPPFSLRCCCARLPGLGLGLLGSCLLLLGVPLGLGNLFLSGLGLLLGGGLRLGQPPFSLRCCCARLPGLGLGLLGSCLLLLGVPLGLGNLFLSGLGLLLGGGLRLGQPPFSLRCCCARLPGLGLGLLGSCLLLLGVPLGLGNLFLSGLGLLLGGGLRLGQPPFSLRCCGRCLLSLGLGPVGALRGQVCTTGHVGDREQGYEPQGHEPHREQCRAQRNRTSPGQELRDDSEDRDRDRDVKGCRQEAVSLG